MTADGESGYRVNLRRAAMTVGAAIMIVATAAPALAQRDAAQRDAGRDDGLELAVDTRYRLVSSEGLVEVVLDISASNTLTDRRDEFGITRFYFDELILVIPLEAREVSAVAEQGPLEVTVIPRDVGGVSEVSVPIAPRLYSGSTREVSMRFVLPGEPSRSEGEVRINEAFAWFYAWAYGDAGRSSVFVVVDPTFEVDVLGDGLVRTVAEDGRLVLGARDIADPDAWVAVISARNDSALDIGVVPVGDSLVTLESWPGDSAWAESVGTVLTEGIPVLEELTGFQWDTDLRVVQSYGPYIHGYAGWYVDGIDEIEIGEEFDAHLVLHEVSHAWFDNGLFNERWITEGLADAYAALAVEQLGLDGWAEPSVLTSGLGNLALNDWVDPTFDDRTKDRTENFGYSASWQLVDLLIDQAGIDGMAEVLAAAEGDLIAYRGEGPAERVDTLDDWRRFLDLVEEVGGVVDADGLFAEWVVAQEDLTLLGRRGDLRSDYRRLEERAGSWALPLELRAAMGEWDFSSAEALIAGANTVLDARSRLDSAVAVAGVGPPALESRFESGEDFEVLVAEMAAQSLVLEYMVETRRVVDSPRTMIESIGLVGSDPSSQIDAADEALTIGDLAEAQEAASRAEAMIARSSDAGLIRSGVAGGGAIALVGLVLVTRRRRRVVIEHQALEASSI